MASAELQTGKYADLSTFLKAAYDTFGLATFPGRGINNPHYMYLPLRLSNNRLATDSTAPEELAVLESPFYFLSGIEETGRPPSTCEPSANLPSVCVLVGEYGLGKTEFVFQLCKHLLENKQAGVPMPLPVNLAMCRWLETDVDQALNDSRNPDRFTALLFSPIFQTFDPDATSFVRNVLLPAIHRGEILLILDGLDELVGNARQHKRFFAGLRTLLDPSVLRLERTRSQCLVSMRLEYLMDVDNPRASELVDKLQTSVNDRVRPTVHFLHVDFLNDSWIESYLKHTTKLASDLNTFRGFSGFYELLHRPIFLQMLKVLDDSRHEFSASQLTHPVQLVRAIIGLASECDAAPESPFQIERNNLAKQSGLTWDSDLLARAALTKFEETGPSFAFSAADLRLFLLPAADKNELAEPGSETVMLAVHKCPFLHKISGTSVVFAHKVFLEYFVARGIVIDLKESGGAFERLVLNSDMRKFLRFLIEEAYPDAKDAWYQHTFRCGLDRPDQWAFPNVAFFERLLPDLERLRRRLLDSMTEPRRVDVKVMREVIEEFLRLDDTYALHPLYLMYNYEAVAVYLWRHRWHEDDVWLLDGFERRMEDRAKELIDDLQGKDTRLLSSRFPNIGGEPKELLLERIADISRRLQFRAVKAMNLADCVQTDFIKRRMSGSAFPTQRPVN